jgi:hypothetical protein
MDQADLRDFAAHGPVHAHLALSEEQKYKLHRICRVLDGLAALTCPEDQDQAREECVSVREDLAAIFELIRDNIEDATANLPYVPALAAGSMIEITATKRRPA